MKMYLLKVNDSINPEELSVLMQKMEFVEDLKPISYWQDEDFDDDSLEQEIKAKMLTHKNFAIAKHLTDEN